VQSVTGGVVTEEVFGAGPVDAWDEGEVDATVLSKRIYRLDFRGARLQGVYELRRTGWYPGNRWLLKRL